MKKYVITIAALCLLSSSCRQHFEASLDVTIYGEEFVEEGIAADEFADGWAINFELFEVQVDAITLGGNVYTDRFTNAEKVFDLTKPSEGAGHLVYKTAIEFDEEAGYTLGPIRVKGSATKEGQTKTFDWRFERRVQYDQCEGGVKTEAPRFEITIHADHFFYDSIVAEEPALRFDALAAADANDDGVITRAELEAASVGSYDVGNERIDNLWQWLQALHLNVGHFNGEGHCRGQAL